MPLWPSTVTSLVTVPCGVSTVTSLVKGPANMQYSRKLHTEFHFMQAMLHADCRNQSLSKSDLKSHHARARLHGKQC